MLHEKIFPPKLKDQSSHLRSSQIYTFSMSPSLTLPFYVFFYFQTPFNLTVLFYRFLLCFILFWSSVYPKTFILYTIPDREEKRANGHILTNFISGHTTNGFMSTSLFGQTLSLPPLNNPPPLLP